MNLFHDQGYEFRTDRAVINLSKGIASSNAPVEGQSLGQIHSNGFNLMNKGRTIIFKGKLQFFIQKQPGTPMTKLLKKLTYCLNYMALGVLPFETTWAQLNFGDGNGQPIEIFADNGVEWRQDTPYSLLEATPERLKRCYRIC